MKVILSVGGPGSGHGHVFDLLCQAGVATALPSRKLALSPQALQSQLLRSLEIDLGGSGPLTQVSVGKLWNEVASDLFLTNIEQSVWGWADHQTTVLMDFWREFDPQVRLLLVYQTPLAYLTKALAQNSNPTPAIIEAALDQWTRWNGALLRCLQRHKEKCVLVNSEQALGDPGSLIGVLSSNWQISSLGSLTAGVSVAPAFAHLQANLIHQLVDELHPAWELREELDGAAALPAQPPTSASTPHAAWVDWVGVGATLTTHETAQLEHGEVCKNLAEQSELARGLRAEVAQANTQVNGLRQENELLLAQLHQVQEELESSFSKNQSLLLVAEKAGTLEQRLMQLQTQAIERNKALDAAKGLQAKTSAAHDTDKANWAKEKGELTQSRDALTKQVAEAKKALDAAAHTSATAKELQQENEILLLQLHQVQEELEHYFLRNQELEKKQETAATGFEVDFWRRHQPEVICIDMRDDVTGSNWYPAEADGRWAGPGAHSTVQFPVLQAGNYTLELDVVDAMDAGIVEGMVVQAAGQSLAVEAQWPMSGHRYPIICTAPISIGATTPTEPWQLGLHFPHLVSPAESGSDDQRHLAIRLRTLRLVKQT